MASGMSPLHIVIVPDIGIIEAERFASSLLRIPTLPIQFIHARPLKQERL